jgi:hypothetical protein
VVSSPQAAGVFYDVEGLCVAVQQLSVCVRYVYEDVGEMNEGGAEPGPYRDPCDYEDARVGERVGGGLQQAERGVVGRLEEYPT